MGCLGRHGCKPDSILECGTQASISVKNMLRPQTCHEPGPDADQQLIRCSRRRITAFKALDFARPAGAHHSRPETGACVPGICGGVGVRMWNGGCLALRGRGAVCFRPAEIRLQLGWLISPSGASIPATAEHRHTPSEPPISGMKVFRQLSVRIPVRLHPSRLNDVRAGVREQLQSFVWK